MFKQLDDASPKQKNADQVLVHVNIFIPAVSIEYGSKNEERPNIRGGRRGETLDYISHTELFQQLHLRINLKITPCQIIL